MWRRKLEVINRVEVSREQILKNYDEAKKKSGAEVWPVLKSNAYGGGLKQVAQILKQRRFKYMAVDGYHEALEIWKVSRQKILLIGPVLPQNLSLINFRRVTLMVQSVDEIWKLVALGKKVKIHLKINTGMNRQGIEVDEIGEVLKAIAGSANIELEGLMSHLADTEDTSWTRNQEKRFEEAIDIVKRTGFKPKYFHLSASEGIGKTTIKDLNAVRLGIGLYKEAIRLVSKVVKVRRVKAGERISYSGTYTFKKDAWVGVVPVGYFEGLDRRLSNRGWVKYDHNFYHIVGNICMNMCTVSFGETEPRVYDEVEVIGRSGLNSPEEIARAIETIPYEVMVKINGSVRREII